MGLAAAAPLLANRLRRLAVPVVVIEILAGVAIGRSGLNWVQPSITEEFLAEFGFAFLMFLSGLEIDFRLLTASGGAGRSSSRWMSPVPIGLGIFALTLGLALLGSWGLGGLGLVREPVLMALILSTTSLGVVVPVLKERGLQASRFGQYLLVASTLADFVTLVLLAVVIAMLSGGLTLDLLLVLVLLAIFGLLARAGLLARRAAWFQRLLHEISEAAGQMRVRGAFAIMVAWVALSGALGVEVILGAFLAGALIRLLSGEHDSLLHEKLDAIGYGFFIPIFFIIVGVRLDLQAVLSSRQALLLLPLLQAIGLLVKLLPAGLLRLVFNNRETLAGGFLLSARLSLIIAASAIALDIGAIGEDVNAGVVLIALVSVSLTPVVFNRLLPQAAAAPRRGTIIFGSDQLAELLARRLNAGREALAMVGAAPRRVYGLRMAGISVLPGGAGLRESLEQAEAGKAEAMVVLLDDPRIVRQLCELAVCDFGVPTVVARVEDQQVASALLQLGVRVVRPSLATAIAVESALRAPTSFDLLAHQTDEVEVGETVLGNGALSALPLRDLNLPGDALILSIRRDQSILVPHGDTVVRLGDSLVVLGSPDSVGRALVLLAGAAAS